MSRRRQERMAEEIKRALSRIIKEEVKDPRIDFKSVSITRVDVANDISHARVNISVLGDEEKQAQVINALQKAKGFIRSQLAGEIQIRHAPDLEIRLDKSIEHGIRISTLLDELRSKEEKKENYE